jgi:chaperone modulatory protein CbpM
MNEPQVSAETGLIFEEYAVLSLADLCRLCAAEARQIEDLVDEGVLEPADAATATRDAAEWRFAGASLRRARTALRLQRDLEINLAGVALAMDLLDEIAALRRVLHHVR